MGISCPSHCRLKAVCREQGVLQPLSGPLLQPGGPALQAPWCRHPPFQGSPSLPLTPLVPPLGGTLKTLKEKDAESLQAQWWDRKSPALPLRSQDIVPLMDLALQYRASPAHPPLLPAELPSAFLCQRLLLLFAGRKEDALWLLLGTTGALHLPLAVCDMSPKPGTRLLGGVEQLLHECLPQAKLAVHVQGLLGLQHLGRKPGQSDGICFNVVVTVEDAGQPPKEAPPELQGTAFAWWKVDNEAVRRKLLQRLSTSSFVPIRS